MSEEQKIMYHGIWLFYHIVMWGYILGVFFYCHSPSGDCTTGIVALIFFILWLIPMILRLVNYLHDKKFSRII